MLLRMFCELCFRPADKWIFVKNSSKVNTYSICHMNCDASRMLEGQPLHLSAVIEIDDCSERMGILHKLGEVKPEEVKIGMKVKAVWMPEKERMGANQILQAVDAQSAALPMSRADLLRALFYRTRKIY